MKQKKNTKRDLNYTCVCIIITLYTATYNPSQTLINLTTNNYNSTIQAKTNVVWSFAPQPE